MNNSSFSNKLTWVAIVFYTCINLIAGLSDNALVQTLYPFAAVLIFMVFSLSHGITNFGGKQMLIYFALTFGISWSYETISILTGFPFGHYHYTDLLGPKLWLVPYVIMPAYFGVLYCSWILAHILLDKFTLQYSRETKFAIPFIASFVMVMWNLCFDPFMSTIRKDWIWEDGGAYYGVPFQNFMGWFLCVYTILQVFSFYLQRQAKTAVPQPKLHSLGNWLQPVLFYGAISIKGLLDPIKATSEQVTSPDNKIWFQDDIHTTLSLVGIFTMVFVSILAVMKLQAHFRKSSELAN